jgi:hypothetical protein
MNIPAVKNTRNFLALSNVVCDSWNAQAWPAAQNMPSREVAVF